MKYITLAEYDSDYILSEISKINSEYGFFLGDNGLSYKVHLDSMRYKVFQISNKCVCCGIEGTKMLLQQPPSIYKPRMTAHFNLYAIYDNKLCLMTKDHIIPRSKGGTESLNNFQTLCTLCNCVKSDDILTLDELREKVKNIRLRRELREANNTRKQFIKQLKKNFV